MKNKWKKGSAFLTPFAVIGVLCSHYEQGMKHLTSGHFDLAVEILQQAARKDAPAGEDDKTSWSYDLVQATYGHAMCYWYGVGNIEPDREKAAEMLKEMCEKLENEEMPALSNPQYMLGFYYEKKGTADSREEAIKWYEKAAKNGHSLARFHLGVIYHELAEEYRQDGFNYDSYEMQAEECLRLARYDSDLSMANRDRANDLYASNSVQPMEGSWNRCWMACRDGFYFIRFYIYKCLDYIRY